MHRRFALLVAWAVVTGVSVLIATQAVGTVRDQVTDTPATLPTIAAVSAVADVTAASNPPAATDPPQTTPPQNRTTTTEASATATTTTGAPSSSSTTTTTTTTAPPTTAAPATTNAPTTTAAPPPEMETATYQLTGGWVRIRYGEGEVHLVDAAPHAGYTMKADKTGPLEVDIEFEGDDYEGRFEAEWDEGRLKVDIEESGDEGED